MSYVQRSRRSLILVFVLDRNNDNLNSSVYFVMITMIALERKRFESGWFDFITHSQCESNLNVASVVLIKEKRRTLFCVNSRHLDLHATSSLIVVSLILHATRIHSFTLVYIDFNLVVRIVLFIVCLFVCLFVGVSRALFHFKFEKLQGELL